MAEQEAFLTALQVSDSFFPSGAFAHSSGLETFATNGLVTDRRTLILFIESYLLGIVARCDLIFVKLARAAAANSDLEEIQRLDQSIHAMKFPMEQRMASMQMGRQLLRVISLFHESSLGTSLLRLVEAHDLNGHHPILFGVVCAGAGIPLEKTMLTYVYSTVSPLVSAGVRLIPLGHSDGQSAIHMLKPLIARISREAQHLGEEDISSFSPGIEARSMQHEHLPIRLFKS